MNKILFRRILTFGIVFSFFLACFTPRVAMALEEERSSHTSDSLRVYHDIPYMAPWSQVQSQKMDIYASDSWSAQVSQEDDEVNGTKTLHPVVVFIHGGAWEHGDKNLNSDTANRMSLVYSLVNNGYIVASINYRLSGESPWPAQINDCKSAIRFLRKNSERYLIDKNKIAVFGESSGGHLAMMLGVTDNNKFVNAQDGNGNQSSDVQAVISDYGISDIANWGDRAFDNREVAEEAKLKLFGKGYSSQEEKDASPIYYVSSQSSPMLLVHGKNDTMVSYMQSVEMERSLKSVGLHDVSTWYPDDGPHSSAAIFSDSAQAQQLYLSFMNKIFEQNVNSSSPLIPVYRFYNESANSHIFTTKYRANNNLNAEGAAFYAQKNEDSSSIKVSCLSSTSGDFVCTKGVYEAQSLLTLGWTIEDSFYESSNTQDNPVYRLYNQSLGRHIFVLDGNEKFSLIQSGWIEEGIAFYAFRKA